MSSTLKYGLPIVILMGVVGVVAYVTQNTSRTPTDLTVNKPGTVPTLGEPLVFDDEGLDLDARPMQVEILSKGNYKGFWFHTTQERDVNVGGWYKSCTCSEVDFGSSNLSQEDWEEIAAHPTPGALIKLLRSMKAEPMPDARRNEYVTVRGTPPGKTPRPYVMLIKWDAKKDTGGPENLHIELNARLENGTPSTPKRDLAFEAVPATAFFPVALDLGEIGAGGQSSRECIIWSQTRERLNFAARLSGTSDKLAEPCAEISSPEPLSEKEVVSLLRASGADISKLQPRCAYRFRLTLHERRGDSQLEIGPLARRLIISFHTDPDERILNDLHPVVNAMVRGDVGVLSGDQNGRVQLGTFKYEGGRSVVVRLASSNTKLELEKETSSDDKIVKVRLGKPATVDGRREWELFIDVPPSAYLGDINQLVTVTLKGPSPRRLRIPVVGSAVR